MRITDNQKKIPKIEFQKEYPKLSDHLLDKSLKSLSNHHNIFIFPNDLLEIPDIDKNGKIFESIDDYVETQNIIGFIGFKEEKLTIHSRFAQEDEDDYFLHYMLQKVLHINLTNLDTSLSQDQQFYQLLVYLFPKYLQTALRKGLYKEYRRFQHHDSNLKGAIDVARHIKESTPFVGKISYTTREFSFDNSLMQLVRHTIEYIKASQKNSQQILFSNQEGRQNVDSVVQVTPTYQISDRRKVILANQQKPIRHAYFHEYAALQRLCLLILTGREQSVGGSDDQIHGILFDVAWLWEEYLATLLGDGFKHPRNKGSQDGISIFSDRTRTVYPDFYNREKGIVLDAKYKKLELTDKGIDRFDLYQMISYSYILKSRVAGLVFPSQELEMDNNVGQLAGYGVYLKKWSILIPQRCSNFNDFVSKIKESENNFQNNINNFLQDNYL